MRILWNFMISIRLLIICISLLSSVKMGISIICLCKGENCQSWKPKNISSRLWKVRNTCMPMALFTEIWNQLIFWWKMVSAKSVILDLPKVCKKKMLSWSQLLELLSTCHPKFLNTRNIQQNLIFGRSVWFIMRCCTVKLPGLLVTNFS